MALCDMKKGVVMTVMIMLVLAQGDDNAPQTKVEPEFNFRKLICGGKCLITCNPFKGTPIRYGACVVKCMVDCIKATPFSDDVSDCVAGCALSISINDNIDDLAVDAYVDSCLQTCKVK